MARLEPRIAHVVHPTKTIRFYLCTKTLAAHFGGLAHLRELCDQYGLPRIGHHTGLGYFSMAKISTNELAVLLELGERMHSPLQLHDFVREAR